MLRAVISVAVICVVCRPVVADDNIRFSAQIRPILSDKCFHCHGPDAEKRAAGLRLDDEHSVTAPLASGATAIVPGDLAASAIIERITTSDPDLRMPPTDAGKQLTEKEIGLLKRWVESGAKWGQHWAFEPIVRPRIPATVTRMAATNDVDSFVIARLQEAGLSANSEAEKIAMLRRVTLDLTGFPPTPADVDKFLADESDHAYETAVDRLLRSSRYGEHMARYWLDAARYGDTHGLHLDNYREMWAYRDWVVNAFNSNMPFDQFTMEQLAGDLLPNATDDQLIATGFNRCHVTTGEGGSIDAEVEVRNTNDRVATIGAVFMGLTLDCCRCHSHKFDPVTIDDYYSLTAFFNNIDGNPLDGNTTEHAPILKVLTTEQKAEIQTLEKLRRDTKTSIQQVIAEASYKEPTVPAEPVAAPPTEFIWVEDSVLTSGTVSGTTPWQFAKAPLPVFSGEASHTRTAVGLSQHYVDGVDPAITIGEGDIFFAWVFLDPTNPPKEIMLQWNDGLSWSHRVYWGGNHIDWGMDNSVSRMSKGALPKTGEWVRLEVSASEVGLQPGANVTGWAFTQFDGTVYWDRCGIAKSSAGQTVYDSFARWQRDLQQTEGSGLPEVVRTTLRQPTDERDPLEAMALKNYFIEHAYVGTRAEISTLHEQLRTIDQQIQATRKNAAVTLIYRERAEPKPTYVLNRGEYDQPRDKVERRVPAVLPPLPDGAPANRLGLVQWLTSPSHPLTSRVIVNRIWQQFFGTGIVKTAEDFGSQGEPPTHPELLDWLSSEFMRPQLAGAEHSWDVKHLVRTIVTSAAYRRNARVTDESLAADPANRLLARGPRFRLDAETLRDQALFVSGLYVEKLGGPSVKPPQPDGLWQAVGYSGSNTVRFEKDSGPEKVHRRTLYTFIKRTAPPPQMAIMDAPSRESCVLRRERTNSPMQALMLMNDPQYLECARALAEKAIYEGGESAAEKVVWMFRQCLLRVPQTYEVDGLLGDFVAYRNEYKADPEAAKQLVSVGETAPSTKISAEELAAWTMVASTLLNLDETISK